VRPGFRRSLSVALFAFASLYADGAAPRPRQPQPSDIPAEAERVDLPDLPLSSAPFTNLSAFDPAQSSLPPLPSRRGVHSPKSRIESLQLQLGFLQADQKHETRVYFRDRHHQHGRIKSIEADSFTLQVAPGRAEERIAYVNVFRVTQEPTGSEKFARISRDTSLMIVGTPLMPLMLLMQATQN